MNEPRDPREMVISAAVLVATAVRMRDCRGLVSTLRALVKAVRQLEDAGTDTPHHSFRRFVLHRKVDTTGASGTGDVAYGVEFPTEVAVLSWGRHPFSTGIYHRGVQALYELHSHGRPETLELRWLD